MRCVLAGIAVLGCAPVALAQGVSRGTETAVAVHLSNHGLGSIGEAVRRTFPTGFPIQATNDAFDCGDSTILQYQLAATSLDLSADAVSFSASDGRLDVAIYLTLSQVPANLRVTGDCAVLEDLDETCILQVPTTAIEVTTAILLAESGGFIDATVEPVEVWISPIRNPLSGCTLASAVGTALGINETLIDDMLLSQIEPQLAEIPARIEAEVEAALNAVAFTTTIDLLGAPLDLALYPERLEVSSAGLVVGLGASITTASSAACADVTAIPTPIGAWPSFGDTAAGTSMPYDAGLFLGRGFIEELLVAVWGTGVLCMEVEELNGIRLSGAFLSAFFGGGLGELIGSDAEALLRLGAPEPPRVMFSDDQPAISIVIEDVRLELFGDLDFRKTRLVEVGVDATIGIDFGLEGNRVAPTISVAPDAFVFHERDSELLAPGYSGSLAGLVSTVIEPVIPTDALTEIQIPEALGVRVEDIVWKPIPDDEWQAGYVLLDLSGVQPIQLAGCASSSFSCEGGGGGFEFDLEQALGCDETAGCGEQSCATGGGAIGPWGWLLGLAVLVGLRRRAR